MFSKTIRRHTIRLVWTTLVLGLHVAYLCCLWWSLYLGAELLPTVLATIGAAEGAWSALTDVVQAVRAIRAARRERAKRP